MPAFSPSKVNSALRVALVLLFVGVIALPLIRSVQRSGEHSLAVQLVCVLMLVVFLAPGYVLHRRRRGDARESSRSRRIASVAWLIALTALWAILLWLTPDGAWVVFPLYFLYLALLRPLVGSIAVIVTGLWTGLALHFGQGGGFASFAGPMVGAAFAIVVGLGYRALLHEAEQREALIRQLGDALAQRDAAEREAGALAERERLGRELHDTVAQGLSSIQMLLHAAEQADPDRPGVEHIRLARQTAATNLAETRRFIAHLLPPRLEEQGLGQTLRRLAETEWAGQGLDVAVRVVEGPDVPMHIQSALLRIAQGALANVLQHAKATHATISLLREGSILTFRIADDGRGMHHDHRHDARTASGMEPTAWPAAHDSDPATGNAISHTSFGLRSIRERVEQLGGTLEIDSAPDLGTTLTVTIDLAATPDSAGTNDLEDTNDSPRTR
ncbi:sensor histidine kinase [Gulosibacter molinativorax]|uniref:Sensor histidine kinase n=1 Tax=Gulosibacter molinativorax TaxID=256821 RepID=A0ABT7CAS3_9MICO|nr:sensor histidine kinase [Gulosibacter molinativorax]MDJ1372244.1 sensor histidine kinase [Gulosibacter molinativorax]QUY63473.1 Signal transduction histidine-protein kinase/phosphatase DegS [Gulosibacter molinativorax]